MILSCLALFLGQLSWKVKQAILVVWNISSVRLSVCLVHYVNKSGILLNKKSIWYVLLMRLAIYTKYFFVWICLSNTRNVHSFGDVTIADEGLQMFNLWMANMSIEQWGFLCHCYCDIGHSDVFDTHSLCHAFGSGAVTTCFRT